MRDGLDILKLKVDIQAFQDGERATTIKSS